MHWRDKLLHECADESIARQISDALEKLLKDDACLLTNNVDERSISHRLAMYLATTFEHEGWNLDG